MQRFNNGSDVKILWSFGDIISSTIEDDLKSMSLRGREIE